MEIINWNLENARRQVKKEEGFDLFSSKAFEIKRPTKRGPNSEITEQRELIAKMLNRTIPFICGKTRGWTVQELYTARKQAEAWTKNPQALLWVLIKKINNEKKYETSKGNKKE